MSLSDFIKANSKKLSRPGMIVVSHPERGMDIINKKALPLWEQWGWKEEASKLPDEPVGAKKATGSKRSRKATDAENKS